MKNKLILYIACSLDGYIADQGGSTDFLNETTLEAMGFGAFYGTVGSLIMGNKTYRQLTAGPLPHIWPYEGKPCYVYSRADTGKNRHAEFTALPPGKLLAHIRRTHPGDIWLLGGGEIVRLFMQDGLIDEYRITVMPTLLGGGLPLFPAGFPKASLALGKVNNINGVLELIYSRRGAIEYRALATKEIDPRLFAAFNGRQEVEQCWRKENGAWVLKDIAFIDDWDAKDYAFVVKCLQSTAAAGGAVFGAFSGSTLAGFASLENERFGSAGQYLQLSFIHTHLGWRGRGVGKRLFQLVCGAAREKGAKKLYISAHSSKQTVAFYQSLGCVDAAELSRTLVEKEPCDRQMEFAL